MARQRESDKPNTKIDKKTETKDSTDRKKEIGTKIQRKPEKEKNRHN